MPSRPLKRKQEKKKKYVQRVVSRRLGATHTHTQKKTHIYIYEHNTHIFEPVTQYKSRLLETVLRKQNALFIVAAVDIASTVFCPVLSFLSLQFRSPLCLLRAEPPHQQHKTRTANAFSYRTYIDTKALSNSMQHQSRAAAKSCRHESTERRTLNKAPLPLSPPNRTVVHITASFYSLVVPALRGAAGTAVGAPAAAESKSPFTFTAPIALDRRTHPGRTDVSRLCAALR